MQNENTNLTAVLERAGLAVKLSIISCVLSAVLSIIILLTGPVYEWAGFATFTLSLIPFTIAFLCALMAWIHSKLTEKAIRDEEEKVILQKRKESKLSILEISEDVRFTAGRNLLNFEKYVPSTVAALMTVILAFVLVYLWKALIFRPEDAVTTGNRNAETADRAGVPQCDVRRIQPVPRNLSCRTVSRIGIPLAPSGRRMADGRRSRDVLYSDFLSAGSV